MTEESDLFCMLLSACREMTGCSRLRPEMIVRMKKSSTAFSYCSEDLKCVIIRNKLLRTDLFQGGREVLFRTRPSGTVHVEGMEGALWRLRREW